MKSITKIILAISIFCLTLGVATSAWCTYDYEKIVIWLSQEIQNIQNIQKDIMDDPIDITAIWLELNIEKLNTEEEFYLYLSKIDVKSLHCIVRNPRLIGMLLSKPYLSVSDVIKLLGHYVNTKDPKFLTMIMSVLYHRISDGFESMQWMKLIKVEIPYGQNDIFNCFFAHGDNQIMDQIVYYGIVMSEGKSFSPFDTPIQLFNYLDSIYKFLSDLINNLHLFTPNTEKGDDRQYMVIVQINVIIKILNRIIDSFFNETHLITAYYPLIEVNDSRVYSYFAERFNPYFLREYIPTREELLKMETYPKSRSRIIHKQSQQGLPFTIVTSTGTRTSYGFSQQLTQSNIVTNTGSSDGQTTSMQQLPPLPPYTSNGLRRERPHTPPRLERLNCNMQAQKEQMPLTPAQLALKAAEQALKFSEPPRPTNQEIIVNPPFVFERGLMDLQTSNNTNPIVPLPTHTFSSVTTNKSDLTKTQSLNYQSNPRQNMSWIQGTVTQNLPIRHELTRATSAQEPYRLYDGQETVFCGVIYRAPYPIVEQPEMHEPYNRQIKFPLTDVRPLSSRQTRVSQLTSGAPYDLQIQNAIQQSLSNTNTQGFGSHNGPSLNRLMPWQTMAQTMMQPMEQLMPTSEYLRRKPVGNPIPVEQPSQQPEAQEEPPPNAPTSDSNEMVSELPPEGQLDLGPNV